MWKSLNSSAGQELAESPLKDFPQCPLVHILGGTPLAREQSLSVEGSCSRCGAPRPILTSRDQDLGSLIEAYVIEAFRIV